MAPGAVFEKDDHVQFNEETGLPERLQQEYSNVKGDLPKHVQGHAIMLELQELYTERKALQESKDVTKEKLAIGTKVKVSIQSKKKKLKDLGLLEEIDMGNEDVSQEIFNEKCSLLIHRSKILIGDIKRYLDVTVVNLGDEKLADKILASIESIDEASEPLIALIEDVPTPVNPTLNVRMM